MSTYSNTKIVHLSTYSDGGAGAFALNVHNAFCSLGVNSALFTKSSFVRNNSISFSSFFRSFKDKARFFLRKVLNRLRILNPKYALYGIELTALGSLKKNILNSIVMLDPDIIFVYWISEFISFADLEELSNSLPLSKFVFVCTDESFITSGCHYSNECDSLSLYCHDCPASSSKIVKYIVRNNYSRRYSTVRNINPLFICPSSQFLQLLRSSSITSNLRAVTLHAGCLTKEEFHQVSVDKQSILNNDADVPLKVLIRSSDESRKGLHIVMQSLAKIDASLLSKCEFIFIGDKALYKYPVIRNLSIDYRGYVSRQELLSIYSSIDLFLMPSLADSGPLMVNEAWSLGLHILAHPIGVALDLHSLTPNQVTLVEKASVESWSQKLSEFISNLDSYKMKSYSFSDQSLTFEKYAQSLLSLTHHDGN